ncbi:unnamed protein product, partial [Lymnaea stagnalis]
HGPCSPKHSGCEVWSELVCYSLVDFEILKQKTKKGMGLADANGQQRIRVIRGSSVYDVTEFADRHPGGREIIEKHNGQDVESVMQSALSHVHSKAAYSILERYSIVAEKPDANRKENGEYLKEVSDEVERREKYIKNDIVDWSKPLLGQVELLGEKYFDWTHQQVDWPIRLFESDLAEMLTKASWWFVPITWVPVVLFMIFSSYRHLSQTPEVWPENALGLQHGPLSMPFLFVIGLIVWTLLEYIIHRWLFHLKPPANNHFLIRLHFSLHGQHHKSPMDPKRLVFPPLPASFFAVPFYFLCTTMFPIGMAQVVFSGIVSGYMAYDLIHYYIHHGGQPFLSYFQRLKTYHTLHHYK